MGKNETIKSVQLCKKIKLLHFANQKIKSKKKISKSIKSRSFSVDRKKGPSDRKQHDLACLHCSDVQTWNEEDSKRKKLSKNEGNHKSRSKNEHETVEINLACNLKDELHSKTVTDLLQT